MANQRAIAASLGLSQTTVARALKGSPLVAPHTRQVVEEAAKGLGYCPNPFVSSLMEHIRKGKVPAETGTIAILVNANPRDGIPLHKTYQSQFEGFKRQAKRRGYRTETFFLRSEKGNPRGIDRILFARGIVGVIFAAPDNRHLGGEAIPLSWNHYAAATVSYAWNGVSIDRASSDHRANISMAFEQLLNRGYRRIGLSLPPSAFNPHDSNWLAGYLVNQHLHLPPSHWLPVFKGSPRTTAIHEFKEWYDCWKPDALLCISGEEYEWMQKLGLSPKASARPDNHLALVCVGICPDSSFSGVEEDNLLVGELVSDIVVNRLIRNERGLPANPQLILVKGNWVEGRTLPTYNPKATRK